MSPDVDRTRRVLGALLLLCAGVMLLLGQTVLKESLGQGIGFVLYWLACVALTGLAFLVALLDFWIMRRRGRAAQRDLLNEALEDLGLSDEKMPFHGDRDKNPRRLP